MNPKIPAVDLVADHIPIGSPDTLYQVVKDLREFVAQGVLSITRSNCALEQLIPGKPWPADVIEVEFESIPPGKRYRLACETYRGMGGSFSVLN